MNKWKVLKKKSDLNRLPRNKHDNHYSEYILVSSAKKSFLNEVYLMYFDFKDGHFHFPNYAPDWSDIQLRPIEEIDTWMRLPKVPKFNQKS